MAQMAQITVGGEKFFARHRGMVFSRDPVAG